MTAAVAAGDPLSSRVATQREEEMGLEDRVKGPELPCCEGREAGSRRLGGATPASWPGSTQLRVRAAVSSKQAVRLLGLLVLQGPLVTPLGGITRAAISLISNGVNRSGGATITRTQPPPRRAGPTDVSGPRKLFRSPAPPSPTSRSSAHTKQVPVRGRLRGQAATWCDYQTTSCPPIDGLSRMYR